MTHWKSRLEKRGVALLLILEKFAGIIKNNTLQYQVSFYHVPGYEICLRVLLSEMQERNVDEYPDALIKATTKMLGNVRLLSMLVKTIFKKTNVHDTAKVIVACETVAKWFE